jgi:hypothetical protein
MDFDVCVPAEGTEPAAIKRGVFCNRETCRGCGRKYTKERIRCQQASAAEEGFSKSYNVTGLPLKQVRIKSGEGDSQTEEGHC